MNSVTEVVVSILQARGPGYKHEPFRATPGHADQEYPTCLLQVEESVQDPREEEERASSALAWLARKDIEIKSVPHGDELMLQVSLESKDQFDQGF